MAVIIFSTKFPSYHNRKGEPTYFVEKIWKGLYDNEKSSYLPFDWTEYDAAFPTGEFYDPKLNIHNHEPKNHTIRAGNRWKVGDKFSPRIWSGNPYRSKQITIAPDIEIKKVFEFKIEVDSDYICVLIDDWPFYEENKTLFTQKEALSTLAKNDGLSLDDMKEWFKWGKAFNGQIISWSEKINY